MNRLKHIIVIVLLYHISGTLQKRRNGLLLTWTDKSQIYSDDALNNIAFYDTFAGQNNHTFAIFKCSDFSATYPSLCILTLRTHYFGNHVYTKNCEIQPPEEDNQYVKYTGITFLRGDRILIMWKENHNIHGWRMAFQVIFTNDCTKSPFIHGDRHLSREDIPHLIIRHENSFDIVFKEPNNCLGSTYCKVTYDLNGEPTFSVPTEFSSIYLSPSNRPIDIKGVYPMSSNHPNDVVIVAHLGNVKSALSEDVYSSLSGWIKAEELIRGRYAYSNTNGYYTLCWQMAFQKKFRCKWLDGSRDLNLDLGYFSAVPKFYNTEDGNILLIMAGQGIHKRRVIVEKTLDNNKCERLAEVAVIDKPDAIEFTFVDQDLLCLSFVTSTYTESFYNSQILKYTYNFTTTCVKAQNYFGQDHRECAYKFSVA